MSQYLTLRGWTGGDATQATPRLAKVFRMAPERAAAVMQDLRAGKPWQFEHTVADEQAEHARTYLQTLGFTVETAPPSPPAPIFPPPTAAPGPMAAPPSWFKGDLSGETLKSALAKIPFLSKNPAASGAAGEKLSAWFAEARQSPAGVKLTAAAAALFSKTEKKRRDAPLEPPPAAPEPVPPEKPLAAIPAPAPAGAQKQSRAPFLLCLLLLLIAGYYLTTPDWYGMQVETIYNELPQRRPANSGAMLINKTFERGWFASSAENMLRFKTIPLSLNMRHEISHGPLLFAEVMRDGVGNAMPALLRGEKYFAGTAMRTAVTPHYKGAPVKLPPLNVATKISQDGDGASQFTMPAHFGESGGTKFAWQGLSGSAEFSLNTDSLHMQFEAKPLQMASGNDVLIVQKMTGDARLATNNIVLTGPMSLAVDGLEIKEGEQVTLKLNGLTYDSNTAENGGLINYSGSLKLKEAHYKGGAYGPAEFSFQWQNVDWLSLEKANALRLELEQRKEKNPDAVADHQNKIDSLTVEALKKGPALALKNLMVKLPEGEIKIAGELKADPALIKSGQPMNLEALVFDGSIEVAKALARKEYVTGSKDGSGGSWEMKFNLPVDDWFKSGYLTEAGDNYKVTLGLRKGEATANGKPFQSLVAPTAPAPAAPAAGTPTVPAPAPTPAPAEAAAPAPAAAKTP